MPKRTNTHSGITPITRTDANGKKTTTGYRARYRAADGFERSKNFKNLSDARAWRSTQLADQARGDWVDPKGARVTVGDLYDDWIASKATLKESTKADYREIWRSQVRPRWGTTPIGSIDVPAVNKWVQSMTEDGQSAARIRKALLVLRQVLQVGVQSKRLPSNPVVEAPKPRLPEPDPKPLTREEFAALLDAIPKKNRPLAEALVLTGMRIGEACALRVKDVTLTPGKSSVHIRRGMVEIPGMAETKTKRRLVEDTTKGKRARSVPLTPRGEALFKAAVRGKDPEDLVFTNRNGEQVRARPYRSVIERAAQRAGIRHVSPHDLRDTFASWAIQSGANIKMLQAALGHRTATLTLDTYASLMPDDMDTFRASLTATEASVLPSEGEKPKRARVRGK